MVSELTVKQAFSDILNKSELTDLLSGGLICKESRPTNSTNNDIVINVNFLNQDVIRTGISNINIYSKAFSNGQPDESYLLSIQEKIVSMFEAVNYHFGGFYFEFKQSSMFRELDNSDWYYLNFQMSFQHNNK